MSSCAVTPLSLSSLSPLVPRAHHPPSPGGSKIITCSKVSDKRHMFCWCVDGRQAIHCILREKTFILSLLYTHALSLPLSFDAEHSRIQYKQQRGCALHIHIHTRIDI